MKRLALVTLALVATTSAAWGQEIRAVISGNVVDPSGAVIAGASVSARRPVTGFEVHGDTGPNGYFTLPPVPPGGYELSVEAPGFRKYTRQGITANVGDKIVLEIRLEVGAPAESITVTEQLTGVESDQSVTGQLMDNKKVSDLPLNGRNFMMFLPLASGVIFTITDFSPTGWGGTRQWESGQTAGKFSVQGGRPDSNAFLIDGAANGIEGGVNYTPVPEAIEEFKVVMPTSDASQAVTGGGVVSLVMKSGTNEIHGLVSHFIRNNIFDCNYTQTNRAKATSPLLVSTQHQWNDFSGMISGPIIKDKFFYSGNFDGFRERQPKPASSNIMTPDQRTGDFSKTYSSAGQLIFIYDPLTTRQSGNGYVRDAFAGNRIPAARIDPIAQNLIKLLPAPNTVTDPVTNLANFYGPNTNEITFDAYYGKFDYLWNKKQRTFVSETQHWGHSYVPYNSLAKDNPAVYYGALERTNQAATADHVWTINSTTVLDVRLAWDRYEEDNIRKSFQFDPTQIGFQGVLGVNKATHLPVIGISNPSESLGSTGTSFNPREAYSIVADVSKTTGRHLLKFGTRVGLTRYSSHSTGSWAGNFSFTSAFTSGNPLVSEPTSGSGFASFLLGYPASGYTDNNAFYTYGNKFAGLYLQDDFKVSPKLTLNLGMRWDVQTPSTERYNRLVAGFDPKAAYQLGGAQALGGLIYGNNDHRSAWDTHWRDFQPRFGVAYRLGKRMVFRGGYGITYHPVNNVTSGLSTLIQTGYSRQTPYVATSGGGANVYTPALPGNSTFQIPFPSGILQPTGNTLGAATSVGAGISFQNPQYFVPRVHQFTAGFGYDLRSNITVEAAYVGSRTQHLPVSQNVDYISLSDRLAGFANPAYLTAAVANPFAGAPQLVGTSMAAATITRAQALLPFPQFTGITETGVSVGSSSYDALEVQINKRTTRGLAFRASYTVSKTLDRTAFREPQYPAPWRVLASFDRPQVLTVFMLYELPIGRGKRLGSNWNRLLDLAIGHWQTNLTLSEMSGIPTPMPDATPVGDPRLPNGQKSFQHWFNTCTLLATGARYNCASADTPIAWVQLKNAYEMRTYSTYFPNLRNPWREQTNLSLFKTFPIRERISMELRAEAFNFTNSPIYGVPNTTLSSPQFGQVTPDQINFPRNMQFALQLRF